MKRYELVLEEPDRVFFSGDDIKGHVDLCLDSDMTVQGATQIWSVKCSKQSTVNKYKKHPVMKIWVH